MQLERVEYEKRVARLVKWLLEFDDCSAQPEDLEDQGEVAA